MLIRCPFSAAASVVIVVAGAVKTMGRCAVGLRRALTTPTPTHKPANTKKGPVVGTTNK